MDKWKDLRVFPLIHQIITMSNHSAFYTLDGTHTAPSLDRLLKSMPLYQIQLVSPSIEVALSRLQEQGASGEERDIETARRIIKDLDDLLRPV